MCRPLLFYSITPLFLLPIIHSGTPHVGSFSQAFYPLNNNRLTAHHYDYNFSILSCFYELCKLLVMSLPALLQIHPHKYKGQLTITPVHGMTFHKVYVSIIATIIIFQPHPPPPSLTLGNRTSLTPPIYSPATAPPPPDHSQQCL